MAGGRRRILVIEDDREMAEPLVLSLIPGSANRFSVRQRRRIRHGGRCEPEHGRAGDRRQPKLCRINLCHKPQKKHKR